MFRPIFPWLPMVVVLAVMTPGCDEQGDTTRPHSTTPTACFSSEPSAGTTMTPFLVDASCSSDGQDAMASLEVRWDWENDGTWDTSYTTTKTAAHRYESPGTKTIRLAVMDSDSSTATTMRQITVNPGGADDLSQLTDDPAEDSYHQWSPDGTKIAFRSYRAGSDVWVVSSAGGTAIQLTTGHAVGGVETPQWSPDGERIAFASENSGIWVVPAAGGATLQLTSNPQDSSPRWSPDGSMIAFCSYRYGSRQQEFHVWVVPADGGDEVCLTAGVVQDALRPEWSPDGTKIAFLAGIGGTIWVIPAAGGEGVQLTTQRVAAGFQWSPDDTRIAFASGPIGDTDIWVVPAAGGEAVQLTSEPGIDWSPAWSPDGQRIAFISNRTTNYDLWVMPATGGEAAQLTSASASDQDAQWSPDGSKIAFLSDRSGNWDIWLLALGL
jgi:Tol biopolymer transport system component